MAGPVALHALDEAVYQSATDLLLHLHRAGVLITAGSDFPNPWMSPGPFLHLELQLLQQSGIPAAEVLKIATANGGSETDCV